MIWVSKTIESQYGNYVDAEGNRYVIEWCNKLITPDGSTEEDHGYEHYESVDKACEVWGLIPYVDPDAVMEINDIEEKENN